MNDQNPTAPLPELSAESIARIENAVFAEISTDRSEVHKPERRARSRRRGWLTGIGVAAAFAAGILVAPPILGIVSSGSSTSASDSAGAVPQMEPFASTGTAEMSSAAADESVTREIIQNATATLQVAGIRDAADEIAALADARGGYVEGTEVRTSPVSDQTSLPAAPDPGYGWISIRIPSTDLADVIKELGSTGTVLASSISKQDVTSVAIDLRARIDATRASVERLTELMSNTANVSELIEAEVALSDRQAQLESYEQQLTALDDQVAMSSLHVELTRTSAPAVADPAGFSDGLLAGWNGLIASLNAFVVAFGFILPWLAIAGVVAVFIWLIRRRRRHTMPEKA